VNRTKTLWLGWLCLIINGYEVVAGLFAGRMGGLASLSNPDSPPSFATKPGTFLFFMIVYLGLSALGIWLIAKGNRMPVDKR
jgi:hypothetical protein